MILAYAVIALAALALLLGRDLGRLATLSYRGGAKLALVIIGLFGLQALLIIYTPGQTLFQLTLLLLSQLGLALVLFLNRHLAGAKLFMIGVILNTMVMAANGGWMPVTPETYRYIHPERTLAVEDRPPSSKGIILPRSQTRLWILSDIIPVTLPWRRNAVSLGDLFLVAGVARFIFQNSSPQADKRRAAHL